MHDETDVAVWPFLLERERGGDRPLQEEAATFVSLFFSLLFLFPHFSTFYASLYSHPLLAITTQNILEKMLSSSILIAGSLALCASASPVNLFPRQLAGGAPECALQCLRFKTSEQTSACTPFLICSSLSLDVVLTLCSLLV